MTCVSFRQTHIGEVKLSQRDCLLDWILVRLQAQLKRRLAVIEEHGGSAGGWRRSIYQRWRKRALISAQPPTGSKGKQTKLLRPRTFSQEPPSHPCLREIALFFHFVWSAGYVLQLYIQSKVPPLNPQPPQHHQHLQHYHHLVVSARCWQAHLGHTHTNMLSGQFLWVSLTRRCLLLREEFSWPINYFLPGRA